MMRWFKGTDVLFILALFFIVTAIGLRVLYVQNQPVGFHVHEGRCMAAPAVLFASGHGFTNAARNLTPELRDFLDYTTMRFDSETLPDTITAEPYSHFQALHRYLLVFLGFLWRFSGVSWHALRLPLAIILALSAIIAYKIFRLGMNRWISLAGTLIFILSPAILLNMHGLRSISKMPFILGAILILGQLIHQRRSTTGYWFRAVTMGLLIGVGIGFRLDVLVCLMPALVIVALCRLKRPGIALKERAIALGLLLVTFLAFGWPILQANNVYGTPSHDMVMGLAQQSDDWLNVGQASYWKSYIDRDDFVVSSINGYARRTEAPHILLEDLSAEYNQFGTRYILENVYVFPSDFITRAYAAVLRGVMRFDMPRPLATLWNNGASSETPAPLRTRWGLIAAMLALLTFFGHSYYRGMGVSFLFLYFLGYTSLLYNELHVYHLGFVPLWFAGYCINGVLPYITPRNARPCCQVVHSAQHQWRPGAHRAAVGAISLLLLLTLPLVATRLWQRRQVRHLVQQYEDAQLTRLDTQEYSTHDWVLHTPKHPLDSRRHTYQENVLTVTWPTSANYLAVKFKSSSEPRHFWIRYEMSGFISDYSGFVRLLPEPHGADATTTVFFPVYEQPARSAKDLSSRFSGIAVQAKDREAFLGVYRVENASDYRLWPLFTLPGDMRDLQWRQTLQLRQQPLYSQYQLLAPWLEQMDLLERAQEQHDHEMIAELMNFIERYPYNAALYLALGQIHVIRHENHAAEAIYQQARARFPYLSVFYFCLDALWQEHEDGDTRQANWSALATDHPDNADIHYWLGRSQKRADAYDNAQAAFETAVALDPRVAAFHRALGKVYGALDNYEAALTAFQKALNLTPTSLDILASQAHAYTQLGNHESAITALQYLLMRYPDYRPAATQLYETCLDNTAVDVHITIWRNITETHPQAKTPRQYLAKTLEEAGHWEEALTHYRAAFSQDREIIRVLFRLADAHLAAGNNIKGESLIAEGLQMNDDYAGEAANLFAAAAKRFHEAEDYEQATEWYHKAIALAPTVLWHHVHLAETLEAMALYNEAIELYRYVLMQAPELPYSAKRLDNLYLKLDWQEERLETWRAIVEAHPTAATPRLYFGMALESKGHWDDALRAYEHAYANDPENVLVMLRLGNALLVAKQWEAGQNMLEMAVSMNQEYAGEAAAFFAAAAKRFHETEDYAQATAWYHKAIALAPTVLWHHVHLAETLEAMALYEEAIELYRYVLMQAPESPYSAKRLDNLYLKLDWPEKRLETWRVIIEAYPRAVTPRLYFGMALESKGHWDDALRAYEHAYANDSENVLVMLRLGNALLVAEQWEAGQNMLEMAVSMNQEYAGEAAAFFAAAAKRFHEAEDYEQAAAWYQKAIALAPTVLWHHVHLAETLEAMALYEEAIEVYRYVLMQAPESPYSAERLDAAFLAMGASEQRLATWRSLVEAHPDADVPKRYLKKALSGKDTL